MKLFIYSSTYIQVEDFEETGKVGRGKTRLN